MRPIDVGTPLTLTDAYLGKAGDLILIFNGLGWEHVECELSKCASGLTGFATFVQRVQKFGSDSDTIIAAEQAHQRAQDYSNNPAFGSW
jgi:hypothetical protein